MKGNFSKVNRTVSSFIAVIMCMFVNTFFFFIIPCRLIHVHFFILTPNLEKNEIWINPTKRQFDIDSGEIMNYCGNANANNIEMALYAYTDGMQYFVPNKLQKVSEAIHTNPMLYYNITEEEFYYYDLNSKKLLPFYKINYEEFEDSTKEFICKINTTYNFSLSYDDISITLFYTLPAAQ